MSGIVLHPVAFADLEEIWEFIAVDSLDAADRVMNEIQDAIRVLISFPQMGHCRSELTSRPAHPVVWP
jgi:plasmid stabilization system protein ParE